MKQKKIDICTDNDIHLWHDDEGDMKIYSLEENHNPCGKPPR